MTTVPTPSENTPQNNFPIGKVFTVVLLLALLGMLSILVSDYGYYTKKMEGRIIQEVIGRQMTAFGIKGDRNSAYMKPINDVTALYARGEITSEQLNGVKKALAESPAFAGIALEMFETNYIIKHFTEGPEFEAATQTVRRYRKGIFDGQISIEEGMAIMRGCLKQAPIKTEQKRLRKKLTLKELNHFLALMKSTADAIGIPTQATRPDTATYLKRYIDYGIANPVEKTADK